ncbi:PH domain-containing protein [Lipingzhangella sp. LS1_29]|uniref:PH domain-containing protein n=1 Tax=Lipingzhangella rawalii TaxID=2055835 RepID=A0ABU2H313_9ACTN|nr:PH domain-containing protein [Lipingzhangella rawalii]MDS1269697.1 PH domain-containing protein [Lipingzhangella rawalii]
MTEETTTETHPAPAWHRLSPLTVWAGVVVLVTLFGIPGLVLAVIVGIAAPSWLWGLLVVLATTLLVGSGIGFDILRYRRTQYQVTPERMELRSGVLSRAHRSLPRERIRSVDVASPIWARPFGLCRVTVGTGQSVTSGSDQLTLTCVTVADGDWLRRVLLHQDDEPAVEEAAQRQPAGEEPAGSDLPQRGELARMRTPWFGYGAAAPGPAALSYSVLGGLAASTAQFPITWILDQLDIETNRASVPVGLTALALALGVLALGALVALALQVESWWGYRLTREPDRTLRVRRGLLNLSSVSVEERRLRGVRLKHYLPLRWFGAASVGAVASGLDQESGQGGQGGGLVPKSALSPEMPRAEANRVAAAALPGVDFSRQLTAHPRAALKRRLVRAGAVVLAAVVLLAAAITIAVVATPQQLPAAIWWGAAVLVLLVAVAAVTYAVSSYRGLGYGLGTRQVYLRRGVVARATVALNRDAVIGWTVRRSPFQRRLGLATLGATTAAEAGVFHAVDVDLHGGLALADEAVPELLAPFLERD